MKPFNKLFYCTYSWLCFFGWMVRFESIPYLEKYIRLNPVLLVIWVIFIKACNSKGVFKDSSPGYFPFKFRRYLVGSQYG